MLNAYFACFVTLSLISFFCHTKMGQKAAWKRTSDTSAADLFLLPSFLKVKFPETFHSEFAILPKYYW